MKKLLLPVVISLFLVACSPVLSKKLFESGSTDISFPAVTENPDIYKGNLFILGGIIVQTKVTEEGSLIEAVYVPVNKRGYLREIERTNNRFLAIYPKDKGFLDPLIYYKGREITMAGELIEARPGRIDEMEYKFLLFEIKELYLWKERRVYSVAPPYYPYTYPYWWSDPWWSYYPYPYGYPFYRW